jgi:hypothetical protein
VAHSLAESLNARHDALTEFGWRNNLRLGWSETSQPYTSLGLAANLSFLIRVQDGAVDLDLFTTGSTGYKIQLVWCIRMPALLDCPDRKRSL